MTPRLPYEAGLRRALQWLLALALGAVLLRALAYYWLPGLPWAFERDLGFDYWTTEYVRALVHTPADAIDALGWSSWYDIPQFYYNSLFSYIFTVALSFATHGAWQAIKLFQILLLIAAGTGAFALMRQFGRSATWAALAGVVYAALPVVSLNVRDGLSLLLPPALIPWCFAACVALVRRFGVRSLPFCAAICSICGTLPHVEYFAFVSLPAYAIVATYALSRARRTRGDWMFALAGLPFLVLPAAYFVLPTYAQSVLGDASYQASQQTGQLFLAYLSQNVLDLLALVPHTQLLDPEPVANASPHYGIALVAGAIVWWLALSAIPDLRRWRFAIPFAVVALLAALSLGPNFPGAGLSWRALSYVPFLNALRTPDRFLVIPGLFVALACVDRLRLFTSRPAFPSRGTLAAGIFVAATALFALWIVDLPSFVHPDVIFPAIALYFNGNDLISRAGASLLIVAFVALDRTLRAPNARAVAAGATAALLVALLLSFAALTHVWENETDVDTIEPHLAEINAIVTNLDHRTAALATAKKGSHLDGAGYGVPVPRILNVWEVGSRWGQDGIGGQGIFGRDGFASIIASNVWARQYQSLGPDFANIYAAMPYGHTVFSGSDGNLVVQAIEAPDAQVTLSRPACLWGGPGHLDQLLALPELRGVDFLAPEAACAGTFYQNFDALSAIAPSRVTAWYPGTKLCKDCQPLRDADFGFPPERFALKQPWYRNSVDGDTPTFDPAGAAYLADGQYVTERKFSIALPATLPAGAQLAIRYASHLYATLVLTLPDGSQRSVRLLPEHGLRWILLPLDGVRCAQAACALAVTLRAEPFWPDRSGYTWNGFALDGAAILNPAQLAAVTGAASPGAAAVPTALFDAVVDPAYREYSGAGNGRPWTGPAGRYVVAVRAPVALDGRLGLQIPGEGVDVFAKRNGDSNDPTTLLYRITTLRPGDTIDAGIVDSAGKIVDRTHVSIRTVASEPSLAWYNPGTGVFSSDLIFYAGPQSLAPVAQAHGLSSAAFTPAGITATTGAYLKIRLPGFGRPTLFSVATTGASGQGTVHLALYCGKTLATQIVNAEFANAVLGEIASSPSCTLYATWQKKLTLSRLYVYATPVTALRERATIWLPAGRYAVLARFDDLTPATLPLALSIDGKRATPIVAVKRTGYHRIAATLATAKNGFLVFLPAGSIFTAGTPPPASFVRDGTIRYTVTLAGPSAIKTTHLNDGHWVLEGGSGPAPAAYTCNLYETCFPNVPPGTYRLVHRWPAAIAEGFAITVLSVLIALACLLLPGAPRPANRT